MSFAAEPYGVFVDDLVSSLTGGVVREEAVFLPEKRSFRLGSRADFVAATVRMHGIAGGAYMRFQAEIDFTIADDGTITWQEGDPGIPAAGATWPDRGSHFYVNYERKPENRPLPRLTDRNPGSVLRTLAETFAREYAVISKQIERVYEGAYLATATERDLEQVVALVGVERRTRTVAAGELVFSRTTPAPADIFIPEGTLVSSAEVPAVTVETTENRTLRADSLSVAAPVRSLVAGPAGVALANALTVIHRPILGVESVTNPQALAFAGSNEDDESLRRRAARALQAGGRSTVDAIIGGLTAIDGIREQDVRITEDHVAFPGVIKVIVAADLDESRSRHAAAVIDAFRPAGIKVVHNLPITPAAAIVPGSEPGEDPGSPPPAAIVVDGRWSPIGVKVVVTPGSAALSGAQKVALKSAAEAAVRAAIERQGIGATIIYNQLVAAVMAVEGVYDVSIDLYGAGGEPRGRRNLMVAGDTRPRLAELTVVLRGALVALDVTATVHRKAPVPGEQPMALDLVRDHIAASLGLLVSGVLPGGVISKEVLLGALPDTDDYHVKPPVSYTAEFVDQGLRLTRNNVEIRLDAEQQMWIRSLTVIDDTPT